MKLSKPAVFVRSLLHPSYISALVTVFAAIAVAPLAAGTEPPSSGERLELVIRAGNEWSHVKKFGIAKVTLRPQFAVWLEREDGTYVCEFLVTKKSAKSAWRKIKRPEALPVWSHARGIKASDGLFMPSKEAPLSDAVSGATPKVKGRESEFRYELKLPPGLERGNYRFLVELNNSFDYNDTFAETISESESRANGINGQPSVVYAAPLELEGETGAQVLRNSEAVRLEFVGTGHLSGANGTILPGREGLTSALEIIESLEIRIARGRSK